MNVLSYILLLLTAAITVASDPPDNLPPLNETKFSEFLYSGNGCAAGTVSIELWPNQTVSLVLFIGSLLSRAITQLSD